MNKENCKKNISLAWCLVILVTLLAPRAQAETVYYVDSSNGNDNYDGVTESTPWKTISKVNITAFDPGDRILFKKGGEWRERLTIPSSGTTRSPITFGAYGIGARPKINASNIITGWTDEGTINVWKAALNTKPNQVFFDDILGTKKSSISNCNSARDWYWVSNFLYVYSKSDPDTVFTDPGIEAEKRPYCIYSDGKDNIKLTGLHLRGGNSLPLFVRGNGTDFEVDNCVLEKSYTSGVEIKNTTNFSIHDCIIRDNPVNGIWSNTSTNTAIYSNTFTGNGFGSSGDKNTIGVWQSPNCSIYLNTIIQSNGQDAIECGANDNSTTLRVYRNWIDCSNGTGKGILVMNGDYSIYYNVFVGNKSAEGIMVADEGNDPATVEIFNNVLYGWNESIECYDNGVSVHSATSIVIKNNISANANSLHIRVKSVIDEKTTLDYNCYDDNIGTKFEWSRSRYNFSDYKTNSSQDVNAVQADPRFISAGSGNFAIQTSSPCRDTGDDVGLNTDFIGTSVPQNGVPDIGAYELINNNPLNVNIIANPASGWIPLKVNFESSVNGGDLPYLYLWEFGDGQSSSTQNPTHTYSSSGEYTVTLTVTDSINIENSDSIIIRALSNTEDTTLSISSTTGSPASGSGGNTDPPSGIYQYSAGASAHISASHNPNFRFSKWTGDVENSVRGDRNITLNMDLDRSITARFCSKCGDVNGDLAITPTDAQITFDIFLGRITNPTHCQNENADVNCDGTKAEPNVSPYDSQAIFENYLGQRNLPADCSLNSRSTSIKTVSVNENKITELHLIIPDIKMKQRGMIHIPVSINNPIILNSFGFDLQYESSAITFIGITRTEVTKDFIQVDGHVTNEGILRVGGYRTNLNPCVLSGEVVILIFQADSNVIEDTYIQIIRTYDDLKNASLELGSALLTHSN